MIYNTCHALLSWLIVGIAVSACDSPDQKSAPIAPRSRSQAVLGTAVAKPTDEQVPVGQAVSSAPRVKRSGALCVKGARAIGKRLPSDAIGARARAGEALPSLSRFADGQSWVWVNFWAAWCAPCKEEIPRLLRWERQLASEGTRVRVAFMSVDDDERQLSEYLASSGASGLASTLWLREGKERETWLSSMGLEADPQLPLHLLVSPDGEVKCVIQGAVEDEDYVAVKAVVSGR